jgi:hypothetical protein
VASPVGERLVVKMKEHTIFIVEGNDIASFASIKDAQLDLEVIDVENDIYVGYDHEGRLLKLAVDGRKKRVVITLAENKPSHAKELEAVIRTYLEQVGEPLPNDPAYDLPYLVGVWNKFLGNQRWWGRRRKKGRN